MDWALFFAALFDAFMKCRENQTKGEIEARLDKPGFREYRVIRRAVRSQGLPRVERRAATKEAWEDLCTISEEERSELVEEAEATYVASKSPTTVAE